ncbi:YceK/YidQ family lipoprotein [Siccibacter turicensis]|uniref:YceK/YidQ family lipoprotein n=1 Tax=Siccibacter turicensis TaxID=357233 RepID=A0A2P8VQE5_9ENTR|nr:YceK/YidQ family lipoprotein [Siccibacter turicensis]MDY0971174.1 YceK/YidQ family lipoprotein [Siccibacter turicensis]PSN09765.1 YceK/YidQ family lipoprotein [Siccibacter turicensis]
MKAVALIVIACLLSGCGSIVSRTIPGQGKGNQYYPGVQWDVRDSAWRYVTILDLPFSLVFDTLLLPVDIAHGPYE